MRHPPERHPDLVAFSVEVLGSRVQIHDASRSYGRASVLWRIEAGGSRYWLKQHEARIHYDRELGALAGPARDAAGMTVPSIIGRNDQLGAMLASNVVGSHPAQLDLSTAELAEVHRLAGAAVRSLHEVPVAQPELPYSAQFTASLERALALSEPHLDADTIVWARHIADQGSAFEGCTRVVAHMDYSPRNWLVERTGGELRLGVIDWERSRVDHWLHDVQRMVPDDWEQNPALRTAFFEGYGRQPDEYETAQLDLLVLLGAIGAVWWSADHGDTDYEAYGRRLVAKMREKLGE